MAPPPVQTPVLDAKRTAAALGVPATGVGFGNFVGALPAEDILPAAFEETGVPAAGRAREAFLAGNYGSSALNAGAAALMIAGLFPGGKGLTKGGKLLGEAAEDITSAAGKGTGAAASTPALPAPVAQPALPAPTSGPAINLPPPVEVLPPLPPAPAAPAPAALNAIVETSAPGEIPTSLTDRELRDAFTLQVGDKVPHKASRATDFPDSTRGSKRKLPLFHGTSSAGAKESIIREGFNTGRSAELKIPGTSSSLTAETAGRFAGSPMPGTRQTRQERVFPSAAMPSVGEPKVQDALDERALQNETRLNEVGSALEDRMLVVDIPDSVVQGAMNLSPARYTVSTAQQLGRLLGAHKPMNYYNEHEFWAYGQGGQRGQGFLFPREMTVAETDRATRLVLRAGEEKEQLKDLSAQYADIGRTDRRNDFAYRDSIMRTGHVGPSGYRNILADAATSESRAFRAAWWYRQEDIADNADIAIDLLGDIQAAGFNHKLTPAQMEEFFWGPDKKLEAGHGPVERLTKFRGWGQEDLEWIIKAGALWRNVMAQKRVSQRAANALKAAQRSMREAEGHAQNISMLPSIESLQMGLDQLEHQLSLARLNINASPSGRSIFEITELRDDAAYRLAETRAVTERINAEMAAAKKKSEDLLAEHGPVMNEAHRKMVRARHELYQYFAGSRRSHAMEFRESQRLGFWNDGLTSSVTGDTRAVPQPSTPAEKFKLDNPAMGLSDIEANVNVLENAIKGATSAGPMTSAFVDSEITSLVAQANQPTGAPFVIGQMMAKTLADNASPNKYKTLSDLVGSGKLVVNSAPGFSPTQSTVDPFDPGAFQHFVTEQEAKFAASDLVDNIIDHNADPAIELPDMSTEELDEILLVADPEQYNIIGEVINEGKLGPPSGLPPTQYQFFDGPAEAFNAAEDLAAVIEDPVNAGFALPHVPQAELDEMLLVADTHAATVIEDAIDAGKLNPAIDELSAVPEPKLESFLKDLIEPEPIDPKVSSELMDILDNSLPEGVSTESVFMPGVSVGELQSAAMTMLESLPDKALPTQVSKFEMKALLDASEHEVRLMLVEAYQKGQIVVK